MTLRDLQTQFKDSIFDETLLQKPHENFAANFSDHGKKISLENRMTVYRSTVVGGLTDVIVATFPLLHKLVGEEFLRQAATLYVRANPPTKACLNVYGATFPAFIAAYKLAQTLPYLADVARLEWAWEEAQHAPDDQPLLTDTLAALPQEQLPDLKLPLRSSVHLIRTPYPLDKIVDFCRADGEGQPPDMTPTDDNFFMVARPALQVQLRQIDKGEFTFLSALSQDSTIMDAVEQALAVVPAFDVTACLQKHLQLGTFSSIAAV